jgi:outer membrane protein OmpA-like peptidoglycan-associated protein
VKLFIAGHTDTVAAADYNRELSRARARAIAGYFRGRGLRIQIRCAGLGEDAPLVATPDETDEPKNRRAEYIVAVEPPPIRNAGVEPRWEALP